MHLGNACSAWTTGPAESNIGKHYVETGLEKGTSLVRNTKDDSEYPPLKTVVLSLGALYMAFFLSALVSLPSNVGDVGS